jgi:hypothetical protein
MSKAARKRSNAVAVRALTDPDAEQQSARGMEGGPMEPEPKLNPRFARLLCKLFVKWQQEPGAWTSKPSE